MQGKKCVSTLLQWATTHKGKGREAKALQYYQTCDESRHLLYCDCAMPIACDASLEILLSSSFSQSVVVFCSLLSDSLTHAFANVTRLGVSPSNVSYEQMRTDAYANPL
jgi:hypothetical protein